MHNVEQAVMNDIGARLTKMIESTDATTRALSIPARPKRKSIWKKFFGFLFRRTNERP
jgi:hypothetical protein